MNDKVVGIRPNIAPPNFEQDDNVVSLLESLLEAARSGDIQGLAISVYHRDDTHSHARVGIRTLATIGNLEQMKFEILMSELL